MNRSLAILGSPPAFPSPLHVGEPNIGDRGRLLERIGQVLDRRRLTNAGPLVRELEQRIADQVGVRHCIAMCNATVALEIATRALGFKGEVIVPSFTFIATAHALQWQEIQPVFCDIDPNTHNLDPRLVEDLITPRTTGIVGVHVWGRPCAVHALQDIAERHRIGLMFDAAHAFACSDETGRMIGSFGACEVFSFHATKFFNTFEGGAVTTNDDDLAAKIRLMKNFGFMGKDRVVYIGTNGKMHEVSAAMGLTGLDALAGFMATNMENHAAYRRGLTQLPGISLIAYDPRMRNNHQYVVVEVEEREAGLSRDDLVRVLEAEGVLARRYFFPGAHAMEPYRSLQPKTKLWLPETERLCQRVMLLPTGTAVSRSEIDAVCGIIEGALSQASRVRTALRSTR
jgi:dTDP-4-amino-4,6-dideoxygalactose transaminase